MRQLALQVVAGLAGWLQQRRYVHALPNLSWQTAGVLAGRAHAMSCWRHTTCLHPQLQQLM